ncbi:probable endoplasmic reticulum mannosyl-oligosaccharide 1,2-alpha-mannosidase at C-terminar half [Coccomyxa sp. Obi]|nr:probable endoplasmic reticulum mannosyl-oligosaccharide 1,2-alpha-mannosidase at C-terminar half [Coccomyxa sp. Obi]
MYRGPTLSGPLGPPELAEPKKPLAGYTKPSKPPMAIRQSLKGWWACIVLAMFLTCGAILLLGFMDASDAYRALLPQAKQRYHQELDMLVRQCELERPELMHRLAHEFIIYRGMKADVEEKAGKRREEQAEYDRVHEVYQDRLVSLAADAQDPHTRSAWEAELNASLSSLEQAIGEHNYATWSEYSQLLKLQRTRHELTALDTLAKDMIAIRHGRGRPTGLLKGHPAKLLQESKVKPTGAAFDRHKLVEVYDSVLSWTVMPDGFASEEGRKDLEAYAEGMTARLQLTSKSGAASDRRLLQEDAAAGVGSSGVVRLDGEAMEVDGLLKGPGRSVKANVLWLDVHPDARQALLDDEDGKGKGSAVGEGVTLKQTVEKGMVKIGSVGSKVEGAEPATDSEAARHRARRRATRDLIQQQQQQVEEVPILGGLGSGQHLVGPGGGNAGSGAAQRHVPLLGAAMQQAAAMEAALSAGAAAAGKSAASTAAVSGDGEAARHAAHRAARHEQLRAGPGTGEGQGEAGKGEGAGDDSVRCRMAAICEGAAACQPGETLGCITGATQRQIHVKEAMLWSWKGYKEYAWGLDELLPLSKTHSEWFDLGLTLVDSLDTLLIMGLRKEFQEAREWVDAKLALNPDKDVNLFETTIRVLGGLLAAFHLSAGDQMFLYKAADLGMRLSVAFQSATGIPFSDVNLRTHNVHQPPWTQFSSLSEVSSLSLEFTYLDRAAGEGAGGQRSIDVVEKLMHMDGRVHGLAPFYVDPANGVLSGGVLTLGARGDSYYEYMLKQWLISGKKQPSFLEGYKEAMQGVRKKLLARTAPQGGLLFVGELHGETLEPKMDHLVCFLPGLLALGHLHGVNTGAAGEEDDLAIARQLMRTCYEMYARTPTGLAPEIVHFTVHNGDNDFPKQHAHDVGGGDFIVKPQDAHNLLRPETMESLFVMWRVTRDPMYREWGWLMFRAWQKFSRVATGGYTSLASVLEVPPILRDKMESFWPAETLKYLYLLLDESSPEVLPLDQFVFNTEAHPLPIAGSAADTAAAKFYVHGPRNDGADSTAAASGSVSNDTLEQRAKEWGSALAVIGNANAFWGANVSWQGVGAASREAALRSALTGGSAGASATTR